VEAARGVSGHHLTVIADAKLVLVDVVVASHLTASVFKTGAAE
jgi:hypothetical protein